MCSGLFSNIPKYIFELSKLWPVIGKAEPPDLSAMFIATDSDSNMEVDNSLFYDCCSYSTRELDLNFGSLSYFCSESRA